MDDKDSKWMSEWRKERENFDVDAMIKSEEGLTLEERRKRYRCRNGFVLEKDIHTWEEDLHNEAKMNILQPFIDKVGEPLYKPSKIANSKVRMMKIVEVNAY